MLYKKLLRPLVFNLDPEAAHEFALGILHQLGSFIKRAQINDALSLGTKIAGISFPNRIGLAAGMDKACSVPLAWQGFGFGFIEIGTVTLQAQPGNPKPRLFRLPEQQSLLNRLGFNNPGASEVAKRLDKLRNNPKFQIPLGVNIGKSRVVDTKDQEAVITDYLGCLSKVNAYADYLTINVSSPNTPGLRDWESPEQLKALLTPLKLAAGGKPIFLKISPDLSEGNLMGVLEVASNLNMAGIIATNTTLSRDGAPQWAQYELGGISGKLLKEGSLKIAKIICDKKPKNLAFISVGGITAVDDVKERLELGADLVQVYSTLVYEGPAWVTQINKELAK
jgi:dihydroorotate dehydrogenase